MSVRRKENFQNDVFYHIANYSVEKIALFRETEDFQRFLDMLDLFNSEESLGSSRKYQKAKDDKGNEIVEVIAYALVDNHFHLILKQKIDNGIVKFMQRLSTGYAMYFNKKYKRRGGLFRGRFKSKKIDNDDLLKMISYLNLNFQIHKMKLESFKLISSDNLNKKKYFTSEGEYLGRGKIDICQKKYVLNKMTLRKFNNSSKRSIAEVLEGKEFFLED
jgi:REP element-mobilizing transposase RayT